ncbi:hypothetical protein Micbo1qcDRAFT_169521 [Microdochium bolleyi]|uniref:Uncharacterized protein n=1 Tax=Microdochium bolleyi TaxID=196109 RepID=A0A136IK30_9PEZI|nr:hypothetical protein Micbo1qcDRAFT_169521 [Microdochium bolleyi]
MNAKTEAANDGERAFANVLRSKAGRVRMTAKILAEEDGSADIDSEDDLDLDEDLDLGIEKTARVIDFVNSQPVVDVMADVDEPNSEAYDSSIDSVNDDDSDSDSDGTIGPPISNRDRNIDSQACSNFLLTSNAFRTLQRDLMLMLLPSPLREVMLSVPKKDLRVNREECSSLINKLQCWLHDNTAVDWYWWPLDQPKRKLRGNEFRLEWLCTCGSLRWIELPNVHHDLITKTITHSPQQPTNKSYCILEDVAISPMIILRAFPVTILQSASAATSSFVSSVFRARNPTSATCSSARSQSEPSATELEDGQPQMRTRRVRFCSIDGDQDDNDDIPIRKRFILFGLPTSNLAFSPEQTIIEEDSQDSGVFFEFKQIYNAHLGRLKLWFSVWVLYYCSISKFSKLSRGEMEYEGKSLPCEIEYNYKRIRDHEGSAMNPGFDEHQFIRRFYACGENCAWRLLHKCRRCPQGRRCLNSLPNRGKGFKDNEVDEVWGVEPVFAVSVFRVVMYHCVLLVAPVVTFAHWTSEHPDDLQTASVVLAVVLSSLSVFWSAAAVLVTGRGIPRRGQ